MYRGLFRVMNNSIVGSKAVRSELALQGKVIQWIPYLADGVLGLSILLRALQLMELMES